MYSHLQQLQFILGRTWLGDFTMGSCCWAGGSQGCECSRTAPEISGKWSRSSERVKSQGYITILQRVKSLYKTTLIGKVIAAEGELQASKSLSHAARNVIDCPQALQVIFHTFLPINIFLKLRFLQTLNNISEDSDIIMFPLPLQVISWLTKKRREQHNTVWIIKFILSILHHEHFVCIFW